MPDDSNNQKITSDIKALSDACTMQFRLTTRFWVLSAVFSLLAVAVNSNAEAVNLLGFDVSRSNLYPILALLISIVNIAYCSVHMQSYKVRHIMDEYLSEIGADSERFTANFTLSDVANSLYGPAINRVFPLSFQFSGQWKYRVYAFFKIPTDMFVYLTPISGAGISLYKCEPDKYLVLVYLIFFVSACASLILLREGVRWTVKNIMPILRGIEDR